MKFYDVVRIDGWNVSSYLKDSGELGVKVDDDWVTDWPIAYHTGEIAYDSPEHIPASVKREVKLRYDEFFS